MRCRRGPLSRDVKRARSFHVANCHPDEYVAEIGQQHPARQKRTNPTERPEILSSMPGLPQDCGGWTGTLRTSLEGQSGGIVGGIQGRKENYRRRRFTGAYRATPLATPAAKQCVLAMYKVRQMAYYAQMYNRICAHCGTEFKTNYSHQIHCSKKCRKDRQHKMWANGKLAPHLKLSAGTVGAISELRVGADLMTRGFEVFRSLSPNASCDLAILRGGRLLRIEVRTAYRLISGKAMCSSRKHRADILAMCLADCIIYEPPLP